MKYSFLSLALMASMICSCGNKDNPTPEPTPAAPTTITLSVSSKSVAQAGESFDVTITAPARPTLTLPAWITKTDGTFKDYKITFKLNVAANDSYDERSDDVVVKSTGAADVTLKVTQAGKEEVKDPELPDNDAVAMSNTLGLGYNLGNQLDALINWDTDNIHYPDETCWGNDLATKATFDGIKAAGFTSVRIPVSWLRMIGDAPDYQIDETWMNRVAELVDYAHQAGLYVIVNTHHDENHYYDYVSDLDKQIAKKELDASRKAPLIELYNRYHWQDIRQAATDNAKNQQIKEEITAVWTQIANQFEDCGDWLIMEGFNEINDGGWGWSDEFRADPTKQCGVLNEWNQTFVDAVRASRGNNATRWLGVPTYAANPQYAQYLTLPNDPVHKTMLAVHFYDPSDFTIGSAQYSDWGHTGATGKKATWGDEDHVKDIFGALYKNYVEKNIPVYWGEFGCSMRDKSNARAWAFYKYYMEYVVKAAKTFGMACFLWDNGTKSVGQEQHGYIDHGTGEYIGNSKEIIDVMLRARFTTDASYTLQSVYDSAPKF